jgi:hypothetical protein
MTDQELIQKLKILKSVVPRAEFAEKSKMSIFSSPRILTPKWAIRVREALAEGFNFGLSMVLTAIVLLIILSGTTAIRMALLNNFPGVDASSLSREASQISKDIDIQLSEAEYYAVNAKKASVALREASGNGPAHTNPLLIENEINSLNFENPTDRKIDYLLNSLSQ